MGFGTKTVQAKADATRHRLRAWAVTEPTRYVEIQKWRRAHNRHVHRMATVRSRIDNRETAASIQYRNWRATVVKLGQSEQQKRIQRDNRALVRRLIQIDEDAMLARQNLFGRPPRPIASLTYDGRRQELQRIAKENQLLLRRLVTVQSSFKQAEWTDVKRARLKLMKRLSKKVKKMNNGRPVTSGPRMEGIMEEDDSPRPDTSPGDLGPATADSGAEEVRPATALGVGGGGGATGGPQAMPPRRPKSSAPGGGARRGRRPGRKMRRGGGGTPGGGRPKTSGGF